MFLLCFFVLFFLSLFPLPCSPSTPPNTMQRGQAVLDYDAKNREELSLMAHEVINVYELEPVEEDFLLGERRERVGKVPRAYIRIIC